MDALGASFQAHLALDTNTLLTVSTGDRHLRRLAVVLNQELRGLREERRRLQQGDQELKAAITNISHDLRTPLTSLCGYLDLLEQQDTSPTVRRYLTILRECTNDLRTLTEELFRYSVITATLTQLTCEPVNLKDSLTTSLAAFYGPLTQRGITPELHLPDAPVYGPRRPHRPASGLWQYPEQRRQILRRGLAGDLDSGRGSHLLQPRQRAGSGAGRTFVRPLLHRGDRPQQHRTGAVHRQAADGGDGRGHHGGLRGGAAAYPGHFSTTDVKNRTGE